MRTDESATRTEYGLIAAGMAFAVIMAAIPPSMARARLIALLVVLLALGAATLWLE